MWERSYYTLKQTARHHKQLKEIFHSTLWQSKKIIDIDIKKLQEQGIKIIVLDFDGVLSAHGFLEPLAEVKPWLDRCVASFGAENVYILSNKPLLSRELYFKQHYPGVCWVSGVRKKPYPDGMNKIIKLSGAKPKEIALVDDRLLTGILATVIAGTRCVYISQAYRQFSKNPVRESFFALLRLFEKMWAE